MENDVCNALCSYLLELVKGHSALVIGVVRNAAYTYKRHFVKEAAVSHSSTFHIKCKRRKALLDTGFYLAACDESLAGNYSAAERSCTEIRRRFFSSFDKSVISLEAAAVRRVVLEEVRVEVVR